MQWSGNGHYYLYVGDAVTAESAFSLAAATRFNGLQGYLATITSAGENSFVSHDVAGDQLAWLGGSDSGAAVNDWTWRVGPQAGQAFTFTNWGSGEPNNCCGGEDYIHTNFAGPGLWNDHGSPGNAGQANGYVVEFSAAAVPEPQTCALMLAGLLTAGAIAMHRQRAR